MAEMHTGEVNNGHDMLTLWDHQGLLSGHSLLGDRKFTSAARGIG
jgi:hypothetical protein